MGIVSEAAFVKAWDEVGKEYAASKNLYAQPTLFRHITAVLGRREGVQPYAKFDRESALQIYGQIKDYVKLNGYLPGKYLRPWEIDADIYKNLDRQQAWWGFEFETGYVTKEARGEVIDYCWDTFNNVCFDTEGEGRWQVEITFAPEEQSKYESGEAQAIKFVEYLTGNARVNNTGATGVGTHINISSPKLCRGNVSWAAWGLARTVAALPMKCGNNLDTREYMFGRSQLYGGFFAQEEGLSTWIEGKVFRTTYDIEQFKRYLKVCAGLTKCLDVLCDALDTNKSTTEYPYVDNLYEVCFNDVEPIVEMSPHVGVDGTRGGNGINGTYANDVFTGDYDKGHGVYYEYDVVDEEDEDNAPWCEECQEYHW